MQRAQATWLPDGKRLHLHHGPIDMIVSVTGPGRNAALVRAVARFDTLLEELAAELPRLRQPTGPRPSGDTARLMYRATRPFVPQFITPMAAVAGAGADTILSAICDGPGISSAYVNNGGDVAFHLDPGHHMTAAIAADPPGHIRITHPDPVRGIATSGWQGRSHSLGIADSVTALAPTAAMADAAATMIANVTDLPGHPAITRTPAILLSPESDLGARPVTTQVGPLDLNEISTALTNGETYAKSLQAFGLITGAVLILQGHLRLIGPLPLLQQKELTHA